MYLGFEYLFCVSYIRGDFNIIIRYENIENGYKYCLGSNRYAGYCFFCVLGIFF